LLLLSMLVRVSSSTHDSTGESSGGRPAGQILSSRPLGGHAANSSGQHPTRKPAAVGPARSWVLNSVSAHLYSQ
jgi:hypothetical protein